MTGVPVQKHTRTHTTHSLRREHSVCVCVCESCHSSRRTHGDKEVMAWYEGTGGCARAGGMNPADQASSWKCVVWPVHGITVTGESLRNSFGPYTVSFDAHPPTTTLFPPVASCWRIVNDVCCNRCAVFATVRRCRYVTYDLHGPTTSFDRKPQTNTFASPQPCKL